MSSKAENRAGASHLQQRVVQFMIWAICVWDETDPGVVMICSCGKVDIGVSFGDIGVRVAIGNSGGLSLGGTAGGGRST